MNRREGAVVTGVERGQQVERLRPPHLADHDPVRAHPQRVAKQVPHGHLTLALDAGRPALQPHHMTLLQAQLRCVLDRHHPLAGVDEAGERVEQGRLARAGAAADDDAAPGGDRLAQQLALRWAERSHLDQLGRARPFGTEAADRERRAVDRQRRDHDVDPRAVGEPGVDHRAELVDPAAERGEDALDRVAQLLLVGETDVDRLDPTGPLDVDLLRRR